MGYADEFSRDLFDLCKQDGMRATYYAVAPSDYDPASGAPTTQPDPVSVVGLLIDRQLGLPIAIANLLKGQSLVRAANQVFMLPVFRASGARLGFVPKAADKIDLNGSRMEVDSLQPLNAGSGTCGWALFLK